MLIALVQKQLVIYPKTYDYFSTSLVENTVALDHVMVEDTFIHLAVCQLYVAFTML
jgi:hypothetical protein